MKHSTERRLWSFLLVVGMVLYFASLVVLSTVING